MPVINGHGGGCCGIRHMRNFTRTPRWNFDGTVRTTEEPHTAESILALIAQNVFPGGTAQVSGGRSRGKVVEAVITDSQFRAEPTLAQAMKDAGFKLVTRFSNNTGGMCNILHRVTGGRDIEMAARRNPHVRTLIS